MKKFLYLLLAMPLVVASCEPEQQHKLYPEEFPVFTLESDSEIEFGAEGGSVEIYYTIEHDVEGSQPYLSGTPDWIKWRAFADECKISLEVEANEGEARETTIGVCYGLAHESVVVKQAAKPFEGYELSYMAGTYYAPGSEFNPTESHNYYVALSSVDDFSTYAPNGVYVELDFWAATADGENPTIPNGEYILDVNDGCAPGTIGGSYTRLMEMDANQAPVVWVLPVEGKVVVSDNKIEGYLVDEYMGKVSFRYTGSLNVEVE